jgi:hypothetical protein
MGLPRRDSHAAECPGFRDPREGRRLARDLLAEFFGEFFQRADSSQLPLDRQSDPQKDEPLRMLASSNDTLPRQLNEEFCRPPLFCLSATFLVTRERRGVKIIVYET